MCIHILIGASLSEPHSYAMYSNFVCMWIQCKLIYVWVCCTLGRIFLFDPAKMATVRGQCNIRSRQLQMTWKSLETKTTYRSLLYSTPTGFPLRRLASSLALQKRIHLMENCLLKGYTKRGLTIRDYAKPSRIRIESALPESAPPLLLFPLYSPFRWPRIATAIAKDSPSILGPTKKEASLGAQRISGTPLALLWLAQSMLCICLV